jgi:hypothetical protein
VLFLHDFAIGFGKSPSPLVDESTTCGLPVNILE